MGGVGTGIALGGFMGTGKSTVGRLLAARLGLPFVDLDEVLVSRFGPIAEQLARSGEDAFRAREREALHGLCDGARRVLATGGGAWVDPLNRHRLRAAYRTVVLTAPLEVIARRVAGDASRPLWGDAARLFAARAEAYADADRVVDTADRSPEQVVEELLSWS